MSGNENAYRNRGHSSWLAVQHKQSQDPDVLQIALPKTMASGWTRLLWALHGRLERREAASPHVARARYWLRVLAGGSAEFARELGLEDYSFPTTRQLLELTPSHPDIVHIHNLHGNRLGIGFLPELSRRLHVMITLHDEWMLTGHCAHPMSCSRWQIGCGNCPDLGVYPALRRDGTALNWRRKHRIYHQSQLHIAVPSRWMQMEVNRSMLRPVSIRVINNGVDLQLFHPGVQSGVRRQLGLPQDATVLLFTANFAQKSPFKDYATIERASYLVARNCALLRPLLLLSLGGDESTEESIEGVQLWKRRYEADPTKVAKYYQAADIYLHAAHAETWGLTITEAMACGTPVVATAVGGIPEQVDNGVTGLLVPPGDEHAMAAGIVQLLTNTELRNRLAAQSVDTARRRFDINRQINEYLDWYHTLNEHFGKKPNLT